MTRFQHAALAIQAGRCPIHDSELSVSQLGGYRQCATGHEEWQYFANVEAPPVIGYFDGLNHFTYSSAGYAFKCEGGGLEGRVTYGRSLYAGQRVRVQVEYPDFLREKA